MIRTLGWCLVSVSLLGGCADQEASGRLAAQWRGADGGSADLPARATWCPKARLLEIAAVSGDTGVGIVVYPDQSLTSGSYQVSDPTLPRSGRPTATVAVRWFSEAAIRGYTSREGTLQVSVDKDRVAGQFSVSMQTYTGSAAVHLTGRFSGTRIDSTPAQCPPDSLQ